ncbi:hypothetical protein Q8F55_003209 [Vanrija albida]|uniref:Altered inheritance of mitochondria protein 13, mitochondrial n=1 Tax=Vanrija albida TaxID=181172 RepID=A0ABR3QBT9_9TREE
MGAAQSSQNGAADHVVNAPEASGTSVEFSPTLIQRLANPGAYPAPATAQSTDELVRQKLAAESAALRSKEAEILSSISSALEKENLDREKGLSSEVLGRDIEEVREKVERIVEDRKNRQGAGVVAAKEGVVACYLANPDRPLDCWKEVEAFKAEVSKLESAFVKSLQ